MSFQVQVRMIIRKFGSCPQMSKDLRIVILVKWVAGNSKFRLGHLKKVG